MKCPFCQNEIKHIPAENQHARDQYYCDCSGCETCFSIGSYGISSYGIHIDYKGKQYSALFHPGHHFTFEEYKAFPQDSIMIFTLNYHPNITPQNFLQKLPTLLTFS